MKSCPNGHLFNFCCSSTFAWFSATSNAAANKATDAMEGTVTGADGAQAAENYYLKLSVTPQNEGTYLTTTDGYTYGVVNGYIADAQEGALTARYGTANVAFVGWYTDAACQQACSTAQLAQIKASTDSTKLTFTIGGKDSDGSAAGIQTRIRVSLAAPTVDNEQGTSVDGSFGKTFGSALGNTENLVVTWSDNGASVLVNGVASCPVYYAISGTDALQTKEQADATIGNAATPESSTDATGKTNISAKCVLEVK